MKKIIILLIIIFSTHTAQAEKVSSLGLVLQQSASNLAKVRVPLAMFLSKKTGENIRFPLHLLFQNLTNE
jgi:hypothetical protein